jgi:regulatory protein
METDNTFTEKEFEKLLNKAAAYCAKKECSPEDIRKKLSHCPQEITEKIIARLREGNFLDDARFASAFATDKFKFNQWGKKKIAVMLKNHGISNDLIKEALAKIDASDYRNTLKKLLQTKRKSLQSKTPPQQNAALMRFALSRGFEPALVQSLLKEIIKKG